MIKKNLITTVIRTIESGYPQDLIATRQKWAFDIRAQLAGRALIFADDQSDTYLHFVRTLMFIKMNGIADPNGGVLHIEDDAILCDDFLFVATSVIRDHADHIVQFYSRFEQDVKLGSRYGDRFVGGVCFYIPTAWITSIIGYLQTLENRMRNPTAFDVGIHYWLKQEKLQFWLQIPNLADHRVSKSLVEAWRPQDRRSYTFRSRGTL